VNENSKTRPPSSAIAKKDIPLLRSMVALSGGRLVTKSRITNDTNRFDQANKSRAFPGMRSSRGPREDMRFYQHQDRLERRLQLAAIRYGEAAHGGGSTLTQQLLKNCSSEPAAHFYYACKGASSPLSRPAPPKWSSASTHSGKTLSHSGMGPGSLWTRSGVQLTITEPQPGVSTGTGARSLHFALCP